MSSTKIPSAAKAAMLDQGQRLNSGLYRVQDWDGNEVPFRMNDTQERIYEDLWYRSLILKSRRRGASMVIGLIQLDTCLFTPGYAAGTIAHRQVKAEEIFQRNVMYPYRKLPDGLRGAIGKEYDRVRGLRFKNGSSFYVDTNFRSGTLQFLHISEFGKICAESPAKAREINTGALKAVSSGHIAVVESTAEGRSGLFFDWCEAAHKRSLNREYTPHEKLWHLQFFPWYESDRNVTSPDGIVISSTLQEYFEEIENEQGIPLSPEQRAWYCSEHETMGDDMHREEPSNFAEAFEVIIKGAIFGEEMMEARRSGRIGYVPFDPSLPVSTAWDLGNDDINAVWFYQKVGRLYYMVGYQQGRRRSLQWWIGAVRDYGRERGFKHWGRHIGPHDVMVSEIGNDDQGKPKTRWMVAYEMDFEFDVVARVRRKVDSIDAARNIIPMTLFDEEHCSEGIEALENYRRKWDEDHGTYLTVPTHTPASNGADAFQQLAMAGEDMGKGLSIGRQANIIPPPNSRAWT